MDLTAELLDSLELRKKGRGYDADQVDDLVTRVRSTLDQLETELAEARERSASAEARAADAEARSRTTIESDETIQRTLLLAQRTADAAVQEAEEAAAKKVADAELEAKRLIDEADEARTRALANAEEEVRRSVDDSRSRLTQEIAALEQIRDTLMADIERLEEHVDLERARLRASIDALSDMISRTDRLGHVELPELSDVEPVPQDPVAAFEDIPTVETAEGLAPQVDDLPPSASEPVASTADDLLWSGGTPDEASAVPSAEAPPPPAAPPPPEEPAFVDDTGDPTVAASPDTPPPPPPPPPPPESTFDEPDAVDEPVSPPPPPDVEAPPVEPTGDQGPEAAPASAAIAGGGIEAVVGDLDPADPEDNAWLAELTEEEGSDTADESGRRRFGRRH